MNSIAAGGLETKQVRKTLSTAMSVRMNTSKRGSKINTAQMLEERTDASRPRCLLRKTVLADHAGIPW